VGADGTVVHRASRRCLDAPLRQYDNGVQAQIWSCVTPPPENQRWTMS
jgi:hypothetical protein